MFFLFGLMTALSAPVGVWHDFLIIFLLGLMTSLSAPVGVRRAAVLYYIVKCAGKLA